MPNCSASLPAGVASVYLPHISNPPQKSRPNSLRLILPGIRLPLTRQLCVRRKALQRDTTYGDVRRASFFEVLFIADASSCTMVTGSWKVGKLLYRKDREGEDDARHRRRLRAPVHQDQPPGVRRRDQEPGARGRVRDRVRRNDLAEDTGRRRDGDSRGLDARRQQRGDRGVQGGSRVPAQTEPAPGGSRGLRGERQRLRRGPPPVQGPDHLRLTGGEA